MTAWGMAAVIAAAMLTGQDAPSPSPEPPTAEALGDGVWMLRGDLGRGRQRYPHC